MAQVPIRDSLVDLERHRILLESNLEKLRTALRHWQIWEAEYEGLKEELQALPEGATSRDLLDVAKNIGGDLVTEKEVKELLGVDKGIERSSAQVVELITRRIEYVQRNVESLQKQFDTAQLKLEGIDVVSNPVAHNEEGLPIKDIYEELDEEGNVIASRVSQPDEAKPKILEALKRVGMPQKDIDAEVPLAEHVSPRTTDTTVIPERSEPESSQAISCDIMPPQISEARENSLPIPKQRSSVSFARGTKDDTSEPATSFNDRHVVSSSSSANNVVELAKGSFSNQDRVIELDEDDKPIASITPAASIQESPEDAALRRQMQAYGMREVGEIVAQLDLEDDGNDSQGSYDEIDFSDEDEEDEDEDQYGMNVEGQLTEEYKQEMLALEKKLNARMIQNIGPDPQTADEVGLAADARRLVVQRDSLSDGKEAADTHETKPREKAVRFAEKLDVAPNPEPQPGISSETVQQNPQPKTSAVKDVVTERNAPPSTAAGQGRPVSRFMVAREQARTVQTPQETTTPHRSSSSPLATDIIERSSTARQHPPDEFDPEVVRQEVNTEYYRQRNRIVQKQGGFKRNQQMEEEEEGVESGGDENKAEPPAKKVSLFKAARAQTGGAW